MQIRITNVNDAEITINIGCPMSKRKLIMETLRGLISTAAEKVLVLGFNGAQEELIPLREMYIELVKFWDLGEDLLNEFDEEIGLMR